MVVCVCVCVQQIACLLFRLGVRFRVAVQGMAPWQGRLLQHRPTGASISVCLSVVSHRFYSVVCTGGSSVAGEVLNGGAIQKTPAMADVMAMMQAGVTPANVRSDIVDAPPDSSAAPSSSRLTPPPKVHLS